jgi:hypothetical protein
MTAVNNPKRTGFVPIHGSTGSASNNKPPYNSNRVSRTVASTNPPRGMRRPKLRTTMAMVTGALAMCTGLNSNMDRQVAVRSVRTVASICKLGCRSSRQPGARCQLRQRGLWRSSSEASGAGNGIITWLFLCNGRSLGSGAGSSGAVAVHRLDCCTERDFLWGMSLCRSMVAIRW